MSLNSGQTHSNFQCQAGDTPADGCGVARWKLGNAASQGPELSAAAWGSAVGFLRPELLTKPPPVLRANIFNP